MALADEVQSRYPTQYLANLTNKDSASASTVNTTYLTTVSSDVEGMFERYAQSELDLTDEAHVAVAVKGVEAWLKRYTGQPEKSAEQKFIDDCLQLARTGPRARMLPKTRSILTPSSEQITTEPVRPDFDRKVFDDLIPGSPATTDDRED